MEKIQNIQILDLQMGIWIVQDILMEFQVIQILNLQILDNLIVQMDIQVEEDIQIINIMEGLVMGQIVDLQNLESLIVQQQNIQIAQVVIQIHLQENI